ncbi:hypothetical protein [Ktedonobacter racemifer]|uniref:Uncharacterized protein n=1 Tax=Ktedonobacter racemifer DSM 44963 TaxID=485913 RepID=D6TWJ5_KTERA|nr:hypothetical protein [Ktedonobacter racemifer]EFH84578.1 hypothetical protein Krac_5653 [Ktedonobacter racemifer DSM 44963]
MSITSSYLPSKPPNKEERFIPGMNEPGLFRSVFCKTLDGTSLLFIDLVFPILVGLASGITTRLRGLQKFLHGAVLAPRPIALGLCLLGS